MKPLWILLAALLFAIAVQIAVLAFHAHQFDAYSHEFGSLTPERFAAYNAQFDRLRWINVALAWAVVPLIDLAVIVQAVRTLRTGKRALPVTCLVIGALVAFWTALTVLFAQMPSGGMIG